MASESSATVQTYKSLQTEWEIPHYYFWASGALQPCYKRTEILFAHERLQLVNKIYVCKLGKP